MNCGNIVADLAFVLMGVPLLMASLMGKGTMLGPFHAERDSNLNAHFIATLYCTAPYPSLIHSSTSTLTIYCFLPNNQIWFILLWKP